MEASFNVQTKVNLVVKGQWCFSCLLSRFHSSTGCLSCFTLIYTKCQPLTLDAFFSEHFREMQRLPSFKLFNNLTHNLFLTGVQHIPTGYIYPEASLLL